MAEQRKTTKVVLVAVMAIALASILILRTGILPLASGKSGAAAGPKGKAGQTATASAKNGAPSGSKAVQWKRPEPVGPVVSDPMRMDLSKKKPEEKVETVAAAKVQPKWLVAGIIYSTQQPSSVIIDGRILHEGDTIYEAKVTQITESYAMLQKGSKTWKIYTGQANEEPK